MIVHEIIWREGGRRIESDEDCGNKEKSSTIHLTMAVIQH